ncbi:3-methyladenine DNA glycosylase [Streptomyces sp. SID8352]|nr:3-methyladenine DNA glycosylase [Streptomyces sp. SID8352]
MIAPDRTPLPRTLFDRPVLDVAPGLLGGVRVPTTPDGPIALRPTGTKAPDGPGSQAHRGRTPRNDVMSGPPGNAYAHSTHGISRGSA